MMKRGILWLLPCALLVVSMQPSVAYAADTSFKSPASTASNCADGSNIVASDDAYASCNNNGHADGEDFSFSIPAGSTINGVEVSVEWRTTGGDWTLSAQLFDDTGVIGDTKTTASNTSTTDRTDTLGGSVDLWGAARFVEKVSTTPTEIADIIFKVLAEAPH